MSQLDPGRYQRLGELFREARDVETAVRDDWVRAQCGEDDALRDALEAMLEHDRRPRVSLAPIVPEPEPEPEDPILDRALPTRIGEFRVVGLLGRGGMGVVYEAEQENPRRRVALKVLRGGAAGGAARRRFEIEAEALARLHDPGIAQIYQSGWTESVDGGVPWFALELVRGEPLVEYANRRGLDVRERCELLVRVCDAVQEAHRRGIVHRDLKPANLLVEEGGRPKVLDFGVARLVDQETGVESRTREGQLIGTLAYMSPEQASGVPEAVDERTDVYALGAILYELLAGVPPLDFHGLELPEVVRRIREVEPITLGTLRPDCRGDLQTIVGAALEKDAQRRYASPAELADDLRRYLSHEPLHARPPSAIYQLRKFVRRHRPLVVGATLGATSLVVGTALSIAFAIGASRERDRAERINDTLTHQLYLRDVGEVGALIAAGQLDAARARLPELGSPYASWETGYLRQQLDPTRASLRFDGHTQEVFRVAASPHAPEAVSVSRDGSVLRWSTETGEVLHAFALDGEVRGLDVDWERDRIAVAVVTPGEACSVHVHERGETTELVRTEDFSTGWVWARLTPDGRRLIAVVGDGVLRAIDLESGAETGSTLLADWAISSLSVGRNGRQVAVADRSMGAAVLVCSTEDAAPLLELGIDGLPPDYVCMHPTAPRLASIHGSTFVLWDLEAGHELYRSDSSGDAMHEIAVDPTGRRFATMSGLGVVRTWDAWTGAPLRAMRSESPDVLKSLAFDATGELLAVAALDGYVESWFAGTGVRIREHFGHSETVWRVAFDGDGNLVACSSDETARVWPRDDVGSGRLLGHTSFVYPVAFSNDGNRIVTGTWNGELRIWDAKSEEPIADLYERRMEIHSARFSPDDRRLYTRSNTRWLRVHDATTGELLHQRAGRNGSPRALDVRSTDGAIALGEGRDIHLVEPESWEDLRVWHTEAPGTTTTGLVRTVRFSPDGLRLAAACEDGVVRVFDETAKLPTQLFRAGDAILMSVAWSPDGTLLVAGSAEGAVTAWEAATGAPVATLHHNPPTPRMEVFDLLFTHDGDRLLSAGRDGRIAIWDTRTWDFVLSLEEHDGYVYSLARSPDGRTIASASGDLSVVLRDDGPGRSPGTARQRRSELLAAAEPLVERWSAGRSPAEVGAAIREELSGDPELREAALQLVLSRAAGLR